MEGVEFANIFQKENRQEGLISRLPQQTPLIRDPRADLLGPEEVQHWQKEERSEGSK